MSTENKSLSTFLSEWGGQVKAMIENSGSTEPKEKQVPTVKISDWAYSPNDIIYVDYNGFYTDSDGQIVAGGGVYFDKQPTEGKTYSSFYMKDLKDNERWYIECDGEGSFKILETDNYVGLEFNRIVQDMD